MKKQKALYFDCFAGISGDMTLAALLDLGVDRQYFLSELNKLGVEGWRISFERTVKNGISGNHVNVHLDSEDAGHGDHHHGHHHRGLPEINKIIDESGISQEAKELAKKIFLRIARAEAKVHNKPLEEVHFHEVGAVDSIVDIVGCAILIDAIKPDAVYASVIHDGYGFVNCQHGQLAVPVPAVSEIFAASKAVTKQIDIEAELVTPTGAAIISELASAYGPMPAMNVQKVGWGAGTKELPIPNLLKVSLGEAEATVEPGREEGLQDEVMVLETNLDDCTGEFLGYAMEKLFESGALDVFFNPIYMKKNRPAYRITVVCRPDLEKEMERLMFLHTTTIGIRKRLEKRSILPREEDICETAGGRLRVKKIRFGEMERNYPEYESARELAEQNHTGLLEVYSELRTERRKI